MKRSVSRMPYSPSGSNRNRIIEEEEKGEKKKKTRAA
jgi:hypothetical protein